MWDKLDVSPLTLVQISVDIDIRVTRIETARVIKHKNN